MRPAVWVPAIANRRNPTQVWAIPHARALIHRLGPGVAGFVCVSVRLRYQRFRSVLGFGARETRPSVGPPHPHPPARPAVAARGAHPGGRRLHFDFIPSSTALGDPGAAQGGRPGGCRPRGWGRVEQLDLLATQGEHGPVGHRTDGGLELVAQRGWRVDPHHAVLGRHEGGLDEMPRGRRNAIASVQAALHGQSARRAS